MDYSCYKDFVMNRRIIKSLLAYFAVCSFGMISASAEKKTPFETVVDQESGLSIPGHLRDKMYIGETGDGHHMAYVEYDADASKAVALDQLREGDISKIIYVNRCEGGCIIRGGRNDARNNQSQIVQDTASISEFAFSDEVFNEAVECIRDVYAAYDVEVVTEDPGDAFHHEAILAGSPTEIGFPESVGGVGGSPGQCMAGDNTISFSFSNSSFSRGSAEAMCWTVAQESAHSFGLGSHTLSCHDPMTYNPGCDRKFFRNINLACAEPEGLIGAFREIPQCRCGGNTRNNHVVMTSVFGRSDREIPPPTLDLIGPGDDDQVEDNFPIFAESQDRRGIYKVELWLSGTKVETQEGNLDGPSDPNRRVDTLFSSGDWPDGYIDVEVRSYNDLDVFSSKTVRVLKGEACTTSDSCLDGQACTDGGCRFPEATVPIAGSCSIDQNCLQGVCGTVDGESFCAETCVTSIEDSCPAGFDCVGTGFCAPKSGDDGGCRSAVSSSSGKSSRTGLLLLLAVFTLAFGWRSNRRA